MSFSLPSLPDDLAGGFRVILQEVTMLEREDFKPTIQQHTFRPSIDERTPLRLSDLVFRADCVEVDYHYQTFLGAPSRPAVPKPAFTLHDGQWGVIRANGRQTHEWGWSYARHIIYLGLYDTGSYPVGLSQPPNEPTFAYHDEYQLR